MEGKSRVTCVNPVVTSVCRVRPSLIERRHALRVNDPMHAYIKPDGIIP